MCLLTFVVPNHTALSVAREAKELTHAAETLRVLFSQPPYRRTNSKSVDYWPAAVRDDECNEESSTPHGSGRRDFAVTNSYALQGDTQLLLVSTDEADFGFRDQ